MAQNRVVKFFAFIGTIFVLPLLLLIFFVAPHDILSVLATLFRKTNS